MSFTVTQTGQLYFLKQITTNLLLLNLFVNDVVPSVTDTTYIPMAFAGYSAKLLTPSEWVFEIDGLTRNYYAIFAQQVFTFNNPAVDLVVFGYNITDSSGTQLFLEERFPDAPITILTGIGGTIKITPTLSAN